MGWVGRVCSIGAARGLSGGKIVFFAMWATLNPDWTRACYLNKVSEIHHRLAISDESKIGYMIGVCSQISKSKRQ